MKKIVSCLALIALLCCCAVAEDVVPNTSVPDVENMPYDLLLELKQKVDMEYYSRHESEPIRFIPGVYVVGKDIKAGRYNYVMTCPPSDTSPYLYVYNSYAEYQDNRYNYTSHYSLSLENGIQSIELIEGSCIRIASACLAFSITDFSDDVFYQYVAPEGTYVPKGTYMAGSDLPAGVYDVYPTSIEHATIYLYSDYTSVYDGQDDYEYIYLLCQDDMKTLKPTTIEVKDGNLLSVSNQGVIMVKQNQLKNKLNFD